MVDEMSAALSMPDAPCEHESFSLVDIYEFTENEEVGVEIKCDSCGKRGVHTIKTDEAPETDWEVWEE